MKNKEIIEKLESIENIVKSPFVYNTLWIILNVKQGTVDLRSESELGFLPIKNCLIERDLFLHDMALYPQFPESKEEANDEITKFSYRILMLNHKIIFDEKFTSVELFKKLLSEALIEQHSNYPLSNYNALFLLQKL